MINAQLEIRAYTPLWDDYHWTENIGHDSDEISAEKDTIWNLDDENTSWLDYGRSWRSV